MNTYPQVVEYSKRTPFGDPPLLSDHPNLVMTTNSPLPNFNEPDRRRRTIEIGERSEEKEKEKEREGLSGKETLEGHGGLCSLLLQMETESGRISSFLHLESECTIPRLKTPRLRQSDSFQLVPTTNGPSPKQSVTQLDWVTIGLKVN